MGNTCHHHTNTTNSAATVRSTMPVCRCCGHPAIEIDMQIDGDQLTMRDCSNCETREWMRWGVPTELSTVLADISVVRTKYRRNLAVAI